MPPGLYGVNLSCGACRAAKTSAARWRSTSDAKAARARCLKGFIVRLSGSSVMCVDSGDILPLSRAEVRAVHHRGTEDTEDARREASLRAPSADSVPLWFIAPTSAREKEWNPRRRGSGGGRSRPRRLRG